MIDVVGALAVAFGVVFLAELGDKTQLLALGFGARYSLRVVAVGLTAGYAIANVLATVIGGVLGAALPDRPIQIVSGLIFGVFAALAARELFGDEGRAQRPPSDRDHDDDDRDRDHDDEHDHDDDRDRDHDHPIAGHGVGDEHDDKGHRVGDEHIDRGDYVGGGLGGKHVGRRHGDDGDAELMATRTMATRRGTSAVVGSVALTIAIAEMGDKTQISTATLASQSSPIGVWFGATLGAAASGMIGALLGRSLGHRIPMGTVHLLSAVLFAGFGIAMLAGWF